MREDTIDFFLFVEERRSALDLVERVLQLLSVSATFCPDLWGFDTPLKESFDENAIPMILTELQHRPQWDSLVLRDNQDQLSYLIDTGYSEDGFWHVSGGFETFLFTGGLCTERDLIAVVDSLIQALGAAYGHIVNSKTPGADLPFDLRCRLPDVSNVIYFGSRCVAAFGDNALRKGPFLSLEWPFEGIARVTTTASLLEPVPRQLQDLVRKHLGEDAFMRAPQRRYRECGSPFQEFRP